MGALSPSEQLHLIAREAIVHQIVAGPDGQRLQRYAAIIGAAAGIAADVDPTGRPLPKANLAVDEGDIRRAGGDFRMFDGALDSSAHAVLAAHMVAAAEKRGALLPPGLDLADVSDALRQTISSVPISGAAQVSTLLAAAGVRAEASAEPLIELLPETAQKLARYLVRDAMPDELSTVTAGLRTILDTQALALPGWGGSSAMLPAVQLEFQRSCGEARAYGAVAQFVLGNLLGKPEEARALNNLVQAGIAIAQIYLMFSTGGLSVLAGGAGALSFAQGMGGGGGESELEAIKGQLTALRQIMERGFARLERQGERILVLLDSITDTQEAILGDLNEISATLASIYRYLEASNQFKAIKDLTFATEFLNQDAPPVEYQGRITTAFNFALRHALDEASGPNFIRGDGPTWEAVLRTGRADLCIGHVPRACRVLEIAPISFTHNPSEWARGVSVFCEGVVKWKTDPDQSVLANIRRCRTVGTGLASSMSKLTTVTNLEKAAERIRSDLDVMLSALERTIHTQSHLDKRDLLHAWIGRRDEPTFGPSFDIRNPERTPAEALFDPANPSAFRFETFVVANPLTDNAWEWLFATADYPDPKGLIGQLMDEGYLELDLTGPGNIAYNTLGSFNFQIKCRKAPIGNIRLWHVKAPDGAYFNAWQVVDAIPASGFRWWFDGIITQEITTTCFRDLISLSNDSSQIEKGIRSYFLNDPKEWKSYLESHASAGLIYALAGWRKTGRLDSANAVPAFAALPSPTDVADSSKDFEGFLIGLTTSIPAALLPYLSDVPGVNLIERLKAEVHAGDDYIDIGKRNGRISYSNLLSILRQHWTLSIKDGAYTMSENLEEADYLLIDRTLLKLSAAEEIYTATGAG